MRLLRNSCQPSSKQNHGCASKRAEVVTPSTLAIARRMAIALALGVAYFEPIAMANEAPNRPAEQKVREADLIGIGRVVDVDVKDSRRIGLEHIATIEIDTLLKGDPVKSVALTYATGVYELDPQCCIKGATYLFFLQRDHRGLYVSVDGPKGVYRIATPASGPAAVYDTLKQ